MGIVNWWKKRDYPVETHELPNPTETNKFKPVNKCSECGKYRMVKDLYNCSFEWDYCKLKLYDLKCLRIHTLKHINNLQIKNLTTL